MMPSTSVAGEDGVLDGGGVAPGRTLADQQALGLDAEHDRDDDEQRPMNSVPTASKTPLPVIAVRPTPKSAKTRPMRAATSSSSTTGSSGALARRMNGHPAVLAAHVVALADGGAQRERLEHDRDQQHDDRRPSSCSSGCGCWSLLEALVDREDAADREQDDRDDEGVDVALAAVAERMLGVRLALGLRPPSSRSSWLPAVGERVHALGEHRRRNPRGPHAMNLVMAIPMLARKAAMIALFPPDALMEQS